MRKLFRRAAVVSDRGVVRTALRRSVVEALEQRRLLTTYYVANGGSDGNAGTTSGAPWANVSKVNASTFQPGDTVLFQYGSEWHDQLLASADGTAANPITYGAYGNSSLARPAFEGSDYVASSAFTSLGNSVYSFPTSAVPGGVVNWVYQNHTSLLANSGGPTNVAAGSFSVNGSTVYVNTNGVDPRSTPNLISVGDKSFSNGDGANQGAIASNGHSYLSFNNMTARETALTPNNAFDLTGSGTLSSSYAVRVMGGTNVTLNNVNAEYGGKHDIGAINTDNFVSNHSVANGGINGVSGNTLQYGQATALVTYVNSPYTGLTNTWNNDTVQNYPSGQPAFVTHGDPGAVGTLNINNLSDYTGEVQIQTNSNENVNIRGGFIRNNDLTAYDASGAHVLIDGESITGPYTYLQVNGDATVQNCLVTDANQGAIQVSGANNLIRFNTLVAEGYSQDISLRNGTSNTTIYGNLFSGTSTGIGASGTTSFTADYDFFDTNAGTPNFPAGTEAHRTVGEAKFVNTTAGDYSLQSTSTAINAVPAGVVNPALAADLRGYGRPSANIYDAGAYEYQSVLHQPTVATAAAASPSTVTGKTTNLSVLGASQDGEATLLYAWSLTGTPPAAVTYSVNGNNAAKNTTATFGKAGTYNFLVTISNGQQSTTSSVSVTVSQAAQGVAITPGQFYVPVNTTQQFTAAVVDQFNNPISGAPVTYAIQSGGGTINSSGLFTAPGTTGATVIKATSGSSSATATANVVPPNQAPTVATAAQSSDNPVTGTTTQLSVLGADDNGEANLVYTWATTGTPPAAVAFSGNGTNASKTTTATFTANGQYNFLVTIKDSNGLSTTSSVTVNVQTFVPIVVDGTKDGRYGTPLAVQNVATNYGNGNLNNPSAPFSQLAAAYGVIDQQSGTLDLFVAGSLNLNNAHLELLIDSVPGQGAANLSQLNGVGTWGSSPFSQVTLDAGFRPDHIFTSTFGAGSSLDYYNFDNGTYANNNLTDPATGTATSSGAVPYFQERVNNAAQSSAIAANAGGGVTTGAEFAFKLSDLGYTAANFANGTPIGVMAVISYGSHFQTTNQSLAPYNPTAQETSANGGAYFSSTFDLSNNTLFPGNQFVSVPVPSGPGGPSVATHASASPSPATGNYTNLSVLGSDPAGEGTLTYTWTTTGTPPAAVSYSVNGTNAAKNTKATFTANGTYNFLVTITDGQNLTTTDTVTVTVSGAGSSNQAPTVATTAAATPSTVTGKTTALSVLGADDGGEANLTYSWATNGTPPAAVTFSANGSNASKNTTATFAKAGTYAFQVTIKDAAGLTTTSNVTVTVNQTATTVTLSPTSASVATGSTKQFTASVLDQFGNAIASPSVTWSVASGGGTISASGLYTAAAAAGSATVKAVSGSASGTAAVTVTASNAAPTVATAASGSPNPVTGKTTALSVLGADDGGEANLVYTWGTTGTPPAAVAFGTNGTNASKNTTATFTKAGTYGFLVTIKDGGNLTTTSAVTVTVNQTLTSVAVTPNSASVANGKTQAFAATGYDQFGVGLTTQPAFAWSVVSGGAGGSVSNTGVYTAPASGTGSATVKATSGSASGTAAVTVTAVATAGGSLTRDEYDNTGPSGNDFNDIPLDQAPTSTSQLSTFEGPTNVGDQYSDRIRGYIIPSTTGKYTFWIAGDDSAQLFLSTDDQARNKALIANVDGYTGSREWNKYAGQQSVQISLVAGKRYYVETLHKEGTGGDDLAVAWKLNDTTAPTNGDGSNIIGAANLAPYTAAPGNGLNATYFNNIDFTGTTVTRVDPTVNFDFGTGSPDPTIDPDTFSARYTGQVEAIEAGTYTFRVTGDDGYRLYVDGKLVANAFQDQASTATTSSAITFAAGERKSITLEYFEDTGAASIKLEWQRPGQSGFSVVSQRQLFTTSDTTRIAGGTATASTDNAPNGEGAAQAFDGNLGTKWLTNTTDRPQTYLQYDYAGTNAYVVSSYSVTSANDAPERDPSAWHLLGSNDGGATWTTLDTQSGIAFTGRGQTQTFTVASDGAYQLYRFQVDAVANASATTLVQLAELDLYGSQA